MQVTRSRSPCRERYLPYTYVQVWHVPPFEHRQHCVSVLNLWLDPQVLSNVFATVPDEGEYAAVGHLSRRVRHEDQQSSQKQTPHALEHLPQKVRSQTNPRTQHVESGAQERTVVKFLLQGQWQRTTPQPAGGSHQLWYGSSRRNDEVHMLAFRAVLTVAPTTDAPWAHFTLTNYVPELSPSLKSDRHRTIILIARKCTRWFRRIRAVAFIFLRRAEALSNVPLHTKSCVKPVGW